MENQAEPTQYFYLIQCQGNTAIVCTLSLLSATVVNLASDASLKSFCKSWDCFCLVIMWQASCRSYVQFCDMVSSFLPPPKRQHTQSSIVTDQLLQSLVEGKKKKKREASGMPGNNALSTSETGLFNNHKLFQVIWHQFNCTHKNVLNNNNKKNHPYYQPHQDEPKAEFPFIKLWLALLIPCLSNLHSVLQTHERETYKWCFEKEVDGKWCFSRALEWQ